jgi:hypothetical protein
MTQTARLLDYLKKHPKGITPLDGLQWLGTFRLAARIYDLRSQGQPIRTERVRLSGGGAVARYSLEKKSPR